MKNALFNSHDVELCFFFPNLPQRLSHLVGAGGAAPVAVDPFEAADGVAYAHPFQQGTHALAIAVATPYNLNLLDDAVGGLYDH